MRLFERLSPQAQGYVLIVFTMVVWGSFSLLSRVNVHWNISAWDVIAMRFSLSAVILLPILAVTKQFRFLLDWRAVVLAFIGGVGYSCLVYSAFLLAPVVHGAVFLNGMIPLATAIITMLCFRQKPNTDTKIALTIITLTLVGMTVMVMMGAYALSVGDLLFVICAFSWATFSVLLARWRFSAWQTMCSTVIWSAVLYMPLYLAFIGFSSTSATWQHLAIQGVFHGLVVMIVATLTYALAVERIGAFQAGGIASLAPFISSLIAVPLLGESLDSVMILGLVGMGLGVVQPWRWLHKNTPADIKAPQKHSL